MGNGSRHGPSEPTAHGAAAQRSPAAANGEAPQRAVVEEVGYGDDEPAALLAAIPGHDQPAAPQPQARHEADAPTDPTAASDPNRKRRAPIQFQPGPKLPAADDPAKPLAPAAAASKRAKKAERQQERKQQGGKAGAAAAAAVEQQQQAPAGAPSRAFRVDNLVRPFTESQLHALVRQTGGVEELWMPSIKVRSRERCGHVISPGRAPLLCLISPDQASRRSNPLVVPARPRMRLADVRVCRHGDGGAGGGDRRRAARAGVAGQQPQAPQRRLFAPRGGAARH